VRPLNTFDKFNTCAGYTQLQEGGTEQTGADRHAEIKQVIDASHAEIKDVNYASHA
jgi:hypothetical protein